MAKTPDTGFSRLIRAGARLLADQAPLDVTVLMYRNGQRGILHTTEGCSSFPWRSGRTSTRMTVRHVAEKAHCDICTDRILDLNIRVVLSSILRVENLLVRAQRPEARATVMRTGESIGLLKEAADRLEKITEEQKDLLLPGCFDDLVETVRQAEQSFLTEQDADVERRLLHWAASSLCRFHVGRREIPGMLDDDHAVFGDDKRLSINESRLSVAFSTWTRERVHGKEHADEKARALMANAELSSLDELTFPLTATVETHNLLEWANVIWRQETSQRLETRLMPAWESQWQEYAALTGTHIVAIPDSVRKDQTHTILATYRPVTVANVPNVRLVEVPEAIGQWLLRHEQLWGNWGGTTSVPSPDRGLLDIVAAIWTPGDPASPYANLADALVAAASV